MAFDVSRETSERLDAFADLAQKWNKRISLVSRGDADAIVTRHIEDSLQLRRFLRESDVHLTDLGSGGGFPALVLAIAHNLRVTLIESDRRKAAFLSTALRELNLSGDVVADRIETLAPLQAPLMTARALAPLPKLMELVAPHLAPEGRFLAPKGRAWRGELDEARSSWTFEVQSHQSITDPDAVILEFTDIKRHSDAR